MSPAERAVRHPAAWTAAMRGFTVGGQAALGLF